MPQPACASYASLIASVVYDVWIKLTVLSASRCISSVYRIQHPIARYAPRLSRTAISATRRRSVYNALRRSFYRHQETVAASVLTSSLTAYTVRINLRVYYVTLNTIFSTGHASYVHRP